MQRGRMLWAERPLRDVVPLPFPPLGLGCAAEIAERFTPITEGLQGVMMLSAKRALQNLIALSLQRLSLCCAAELAQRFGPMTTGFQRVFRAPGRGSFFW